MEPSRSPQDQKHDQEIIELLENLQSHGAEYPPELLAARRAAFIAKVQEYNREESRQKAPASRQFTRRLRELQSVRAEYPPDLLAARRAAFIARVEQHSMADVREELTSDDQDIIKLLKSIKAAEPEYPPRLLAARRSAFMRQVALGGRVSLLDAWRFAIQRFFAQNIKLPSMPTLNTLRTSVVVAVLMVVAFVASVLRSPQPAFQTAPAEGEVAESIPVLATNADEVEEVICKPGYLPPLCLAKEAEKDENLTYQGNGAARPAVAKDTLPGYSGVHDAAFVNDGLYGPGASWISNSAYSWIKIDLGKATTINTVTFGRDRLGNFNDRDPGQFVIAVALSDDVYADGDSSNDFIEYTQVYDSDQDGFSGIVAGPQTIQAEFRPIMARFVKITFANPGTAVDEVEVFMVQPPVLAEKPTRKPKDDDSPSVPATAVPSRTPLPTFTATSAPTNTLTSRPTNTPTDRPTDTPTPRPTHTHTPAPTDTQRPTRTPTPEPTDTSRPTNTFIPEPTNTPQPTNTPRPLPTDTPEPIVEPSDTPVIVGETWPPSLVMTAPE